jgi:cell wall-associated NlpC family hydrolase
MALTMTRTQQLALSFALTALVSCGAVSAQVNPATVKSAAQNGAQTANQSAAQSTSAASKPSQTSATNPKNNMNTSATQKPQAQPNTSPAQTNKQPAKPAPPKDDKKQAPNTAPNVKTTPAQKAPPVVETKKSGDVTRTTKPTLPQGRRDPFITLVNKQTGSGPAVNLPPGKGGLQVSTLILQGIVSGPNGMIAVVANPQRSVYFLRVGDELFDGRVEKIEINSVSFHEVGKDAFGKPVEREVTRKLNPSSGDQP